MIVYMEFASFLSFEAVAVAAVAIEFEVRPDAMGEGLAVSDVLDAFEKSLAEAAAATAASGKEKDEALDEPLTPGSPGRAQSPGGRSRDGDVAGERAAKPKFLSAGAWFGGTAAHQLPHTTFNPMARRLLCV